MVVLLSICDYPGVLSTLKRTGNYACKGASFRVAKRPTCIDFGGSIHSASRPCGWRSHGFRSGVDHLRLAALGIVSLCCLCDPRLSSLHCTAGLTTTSPWSRLEQPVTRNVGACLEDAKCYLSIYLLSMYPISQREVRLGTAVLISPPLSASIWCPKSQPVHPVEARSIQHIRLCRARFPLAG